MTARRLLLACALASLPFKAAQSAPRQFGMVYDSELTGEGNLESETWLEIGHPANPDHEPEGQHNLIWWAGGRVGWLEALELGAFVNFEQKDRLANPTDESGQPKQRESSLFSLMSVQLEAKWRPFEPGKLAVEPFVQLQYIFWPDSLSSTPQHPHQFRLAVGASGRWSRWSASGQLGYWDSTEVNLGEGYKRWIWADVGLGGAYALVEGDGPRFPALSLGLEWWGVISLGGRDGNLLPYSEHVHLHQVHHGGMYLGPSLSFTRGRLWGVLHVALPVFLPSVRQPETISMGRLIVGVAL